MNSRRQTSDGGEGRGEESRCSPRCALTEPSGFSFTSYFFLGRKARVCHRKDCCLSSGAVLGFVSSGIVQVEKYIESGKLGFFFFKKKKEKKKGGGAGLTCVSVPSFGRRKETCGH